MRLFLLILCAVALSGCSQMNGAITAPAAFSPQSARGVYGTRVVESTFARIHEPSANFNSLFQFHSADGAGPEADLIPVNGLLYSTTTGGGATNNGTIFAINAAGSENVVSSFQGAPDGAYPTGSLIAVNGMLYGTTNYGGTSRNCPRGCGTVYQVNPSGVESVIYNFVGAPDGAHPPDTLVAMNGLLYGTTNSGGVSNSCTVGCGTVFSVTTSGVEQVIHSFQGGADGAFPQAGLMKVGGVLYGTTGFGGSGGSGTVFKVGRTGNVRVLYSFNGGTDGFEPTASLIAVSGVLYGTTSGGGANSSCQLGCGTVFSLSISGVESVLYRFKGGSDGDQPRAPLIDVNGALYGTTLLGGDSRAGCHYNATVSLGCGTVYTVSTSGSELVLHSFANGIDGALPLSGLVAVNGVLYGATNSAGGGCGGFDGCGTIYTVTP